MKICPKCKINHNKNGVYCSRSCANSRNWSKEDKKKKSESAKKSKKVMLANSNSEKLKKLSIAAKKQAQRGGTNWSKLHTPEVLTKIRVKQKINSSNWLNSLDKENKDEYRKLCQFRFNLKDYPNEFNFNLIEEYGWYKAKNRGDNPNGVSRDHMYSISEGFKNNVDPYYISHPANCKLIQQVKNFNKKTNCSITLSELIQRVYKWDNKYGAMVITG